MSIASAAQVFGRVATLVLACLAPSAAAVPIPISSSLDWTARAIQGPMTVTDNDNDSQGATLGPLSVSVLADTGGAQHTLAQASVTASFLNVAAGQLQFNGLLLLTTRPLRQLGQATICCPASSVMSL